MEKIIENSASNQEFTFKQLFSLIKKSGVRILIFCLIAAFTVGVIGGGVFLGTRDNTATVSALIDFNFKGIESGKDPFGRTFDPTKIKAPSVVEKSITAINERGGNISAVKQNAIINNISIEGITPNEIMQQILIIKEIATKTPSVLTELNNIKYYPSRYKVSISNLKEIGLSKEQARLLLDEIINQYIIDFRTTYAAQKLLPSDVVVMAADEGATGRYNYDFIELYDIYNAQIVSALSYLNAKSAEAPSFRSNETGKTFEDLVYALKIIRDTDLVKYEAYVVKNKISHDTGFIESYLQRRLDTIEIQKKRAQDDIDALKDALESYKVGDIVYGIDSNGNLIKAVDAGGPTEQYDKVFAQYVATIKELNTLEAEWKNINQRLTDYQANGNEPANAEGDGAAAATQEELNLAKAKAQSIASQIKSLIEEANLTASEYFDTEYFENAVHAAVTATYESNQTNTLMSVALALVAAVVVAAAAAVVVTYKSLKKKGIAL